MMTDHSAIRKAKIKLYCELLNANSEYLMSDAGKHNFKIMSLLMEDKDIQATLYDVLIPNKGTATPNSQNELD